jgi:hypothetical protein
MTCLEMSSQRHGTHTSSVVAYESLCSYLPVANWGPQLSCLILAGQNTIKPVCVLKPPSWGPGRWCFWKVLDFHWYKRNSHKAHILPRHMCLKSVITATQRADIRKIMVQIQSGKEFVRTDLKKKPHSTHRHTKMGWWSGSRCRPWVQTPVQKKYIKEHA